MNYCDSNVEIVRINPVDWTEIEGYSSRGRRSKLWLEKNDDNSVYIYKEPKEYSRPYHFITHEIWTEFIAYKIGCF